MSVLSEEQIQSRLKDLKGWDLAGNAIQRKYEFQDFREALAFVNRVGEKAEAMDHHPDITINYSRVTLSLSTHSAGGITEKDFRLAAQIDEVAGRSHAAG